MTNKVLYEINPTKTTNSSAVTRYWLSSSVCLICKLYFFKAQTKYKNKNSMIYISSLPTSNKNFKYSVDIFTFMWVGVTVAWKSKHAQRVNTWKSAAKSNKPYIKLFIVVEGWRRVAADVTVIHGISIHHGAQEICNKTRCTVPYHATHPSASPVPYTKHTDLL